MARFESDPESVVRLAARPISPQRASIGWAIVFLSAAGIAWPCLDLVLSSANREPSWLPRLVRLADPESPPAVRPRSAVVLLVDGLRLDEARSLPDLSFVAEEGLDATVEIPAPTTSLPVYHALFTGVPQAKAGILTNRYRGSARVDSLCDRVRASGGSCSWYGGADGWWQQLFGETGESSATLFEGLEGLWRESEESRGPSLILVHVLGVDATAHHGGIATEAHRRALREADRVIERLRRRVDGSGRLLVILSDHGHIAGGGHGGDEPEVARVPLVVWGEGLSPHRLERALAIEEVAPTLAALMGLPPPRSALGVAAAELAPSGADHRATVGARLEATRQESEEAGLRLRRGRPVWLGIWVLLSMMLLGAAKRSFAAFDPGTLLAPILWLTLVPTLHAGVLGRPLSRSAADTFWSHGLRLVAIGGAAALVAIAVGALVTRSRARGITSVAMASRRAAVAVGWVSITVFSGAITWIGGSLSPFPGPLAAYAPILWAGSMAGACLFCALVLGSTVAIRGRPC